MWKNRGRNPFNKMFLRVLMLYLFSCRRLPGKCIQTSKDIDNNATTSLVEFITQNTVCSDEKTFIGALATCKKNVPYSIYFVFVFDC